MKLDNRKKKSIRCTAAQKSQLTTVSTKQILHSVIRWQKRVLFFA